MLFRAENITGLKSLTEAADALCLRAQCVVGERSARSEDEPRGLLECAEVKMLVSVTQTRRKLWSPKTQGFPSNVARLGVSRP